MVGFLVFLFEFEAKWSNRWTVIERSIVELLINFVFVFVHRIPLSVVCVRSKHSSGLTDVAQNDVDKLKR